MKYVAPNGGTIELNDDERAVLRKAGEIITDITIAMPDYSALEIEHEERISWEKLLSVHDVLNSLQDFLIPWVITR